MCTIKTKDEYGECHNNWKQVQKTAKNLSGDATFIVQKIGTIKLLNTTISMQTN